MHTILSPIPSNYHANNDLSMAFNIGLHAERNARHVDLVSDLYIKIDFVHFYKQIENYHGTYFFIYRRVYHNDQADIADSLAGPNLPRGEIDGLSVL